MIAVGRLNAARWELPLWPTRDRPKEQQHMAKKKVSAHRSPWTKEDLRELRAHSKAKTPVSEVAKAMKRTEGAVRQKAKSIGIGLGHRR
jgi:hypothetical protein